MKKLSIEKTSAVRSPFGYGIELVFVPVLEAVLRKSDKSGVALRSEWRALSETAKRSLFTTVAYAALELGDKRGASYLATAWSISPALTVALIGKARDRALLVHKSAKDYTLACCPAVMEKRNPGARVSKLEHNARENQKKLDRWLLPVIPRKKRS